MTDQIDDNTDTEDKPRWRAYRGTPEWEAQEAELQARRERAIQEYRDALKADCPHGPRKRVVGQSGNHYIRRMPDRSMRAFRQIVTEYVTGYLDALWTATQNGILYASAGHVFLFPSTLVFTETNTHYAFELLGARRDHSELVVKNNHVTSFNRLVGGFGSDGRTVYMLGTGTSESTHMLLSFANMTLTCNTHLEELEKRLPGFRSLTSECKLISILDTSSYMTIDAQCFTTLILDKTVTTSSLGRIIRPRYTNLLFAERKSVDQAELWDDLSKHVVARADTNRTIPGIQVVPEGTAEAQVLAAEIINLYLQGVIETTITQFLEAHDRVIRSAFNAADVYYQPRLPWIEGNSDPREESIQPDVIYRGRDGVWNIVEFKLPLLDEEKLTTGRHARRGFIRPVRVGIDQLANYVDYFKFEANREAAARTLGTKVIDPKPTLVVGNYENVDMTPISEAKRGRMEFEIVDYDLLLRLFVNNAAKD
jgi:hypothetical protein